MAIRKITKLTAAPANVTLPVPTADPELAESAKRLLFDAQSLKVEDTKDYEYAATVLQNLTAREKEIEAKKAEMWEPLAKLTKSVQALFNPPLKVLDQAKKIVSGKMGAYALEQRNIALAAQARADQEAEDARQKLLAKAEKAEERGDFTRADILSARANSVQASEIEVDVPKVSGIKIPERWTFVVEDVSLVPREWLMVDEQKVRAYVNANKTSAKIPGVRIWSTLKPQG